MLDKVLPVKRMATANNRFPRGFLLITGVPTVLYAHYGRSYGITDSMLPAIFLFWSMVTPPHFGHFFSKLFKQEPNTRNSFSLSGEPSSNSCSDNTISSLDNYFLSSGNGQWGSKSSSSLLFSPLSCISIFSSTRTSCIGGKGIVSNLLHVKCHSLEKLMWVYQWDLIGGAAMA